MWILKAVLLTLKEHLALLCGCKAIVNSKATRTSVNMTVTAMAHDSLFGISFSANLRNTLNKIATKPRKDREKTGEQPHDKTNKMTCAPSKDSDQPGHPPGLIRVFAVHSVGN